MEGMTNQDLEADTISKEPTHQSFDKSLQPTSIFNDTDKIKLVQPENQILPGNRSVDTEEIEILRRNSARREDKFRELITICVFCLFVINVIVGLVMYIISGNFTLLASSQLLGIPINIITLYYFSRPSEK